MAGRAVVEAGAFGGKPMDAQSVTLAQQDIKGKQVTPPGEGAVHSLCADCTGNRRVQEPAAASHGGARSGAGAPAQNRNRMVHGLRADRNGTGLGSLPRGASYIRREAGKFQRAIENDVRDAHGCLSTYQSGRCQTAAVNRALAALALRWLRREAGDEGNADQMPLADRLGLVQAVSRLLEASDKSLKDLGLDAKRQSDPWAVLDAEPLQGSPAAPGRGEDEADGSGLVQEEPATSGAVSGIQGGNETNSREGDA